MNSVNIMAIADLADQNRLLKEDETTEAFEFRCKLPHEKVRYILEKICEVFNMTHAELKKRTRQDEIVFARQLFYYLSSYLTTASQEKIADILGAHSERSIVSTSRENVKDWIAHPQHNMDFYCKYWQVWMANAPRCLIP